MGSQEIAWGRMGLAAHQAVAAWVQPRPIRQGLHGLHGVMGTRNLVHGRGQAVKESEGCRQKLEGRGPSTAVLHGVAWGPVGLHGGPWTAPLLHGLRNLLLQGVTLWATLLCSWAVFLLHGLLPIRPPSFLPLLFWGTELQGRAAENPGECAELAAISTRP